MPQPKESDNAARARLMLVEPATITVTWMNEAASTALLALGTEWAPGLPLAAVAAVTGTHDIAPMLREVSATGSPGHMRVDLVSTGRGSITIDTSAYRLPDGMLLVLVENAWQTRSPDERAADRAGRRRR